MHHICRARVSWGALWKSRRMFGYRRDPCDSACGSKVKGWKMLEDVVSRSWSRFQVLPNYIPKNDPKWYRKILETNPSKMVPEFSQQHPPNQHWRQAHHPWRSALRMASWDCLEEDRLRGRGQLSWDAVFETQSYEEVEMCGWWWWWWWWFYGILWHFVAFYFYGIDLPESFLGHMGAKI